MKCLVTQGASKLLFSSVHAFLNCSSLEMSNHTGPCKLHFSGVYLFMLSQIAALLECLSHTGSKANGFSLLCIFLCFLKLQLSCHIEASKLQFFGVYLFMLYQIAALLQCLCHTGSKQMAFFCCVYYCVFSNCCSLGMSYQTGCKQKAFLHCVSFHASHKAVCFTEICNFYNHAPIRNKWANLENELVSLVSGYNLESIKQLSRSFLFLNYHLTRSTL